MRNVRVAVIGAGNMGSAHAACIGRGEIQGLELAAVCDKEAVRLEIIKEQFPTVYTYSQWEEVVASRDIDAVIIATPHRLHGRIAVEAMRAGKHILTEKPADVQASAARKMNEVAKSTGVVFAIMFNQRTNPLFQKAKELVSTGQLGELKRSVWIVTNWFRTQHYYDSGDWRATWCGEGGGVLLNQAPHNLDLWQWICGMPCELTAYCDIAKYHNIEVEDDVTITARFPNGATGVFITSTGEYPGTNRLEITGTLGKIVIEQEKLKWWQLTESEPIVSRASKESCPQIAFSYREYRQGEMDTAHKGILQNFANAILHGEKLLSPGADGIYQLQISNGAYLSAWQGNVPVRIPCSEEIFDARLKELEENSQQRQNAPVSVCKMNYSPRWSIRW